MRSNLTSLDGWSTSPSMSHVSLNTAPPRPTEHFPRWPGCQSRLVFRGGPHARRACTCCRGCHCSAAAAMAAVDGGTGASSAADPRCYSARWVAPQQEAGSAAASAGVDAAWVALRELHVARHHVARKQLTHWRRDARDGAEKPGARSAVECAVRRVKSAMRAGEAREGLQWTTNHRLPSSIVYTPLN